MPAMVGPSKDAKFGDYQANGVMAAAKTLGCKPRELAEKVVASLDVADLAEKVEVAGPGFINITLKADFLNGQLAAACGDEHLGVQKPDSPQTVVVDYSSPNLAKEMHVGHLRSTIIGDALARVLDFLGHKVIRQNHVGDWGTQFGMLIAYMQRLAGGDNDQFTSKISQALTDLEPAYQEAKTLFDKDAEFAEKARTAVVELQNAGTEAVTAWQAWRKVSLGHCQVIYDRLGILLGGDDVRGESSYNEYLPRVVAELKAKNMLQESEGAQCVFLDAFRGKGPDGADVPLIVRKTDGGYLYATTDLAAMRYRVGELKADRILYVTDSRQGQHFEMVFATAREASFSGAASLEHVPFGMMLNKNRQPFKTREGGTVKLMDLLDEAEQRAAAVVTEKNPDLSEDEKKNVAHVVGIGAVKYADLSQNRASDYVFDWDRMLALEGNTAPYMQYAYARIRSIFRKDEDRSEIEDRRSKDLCIAEASERGLGLRLLQFPETIQAVADECLPSTLCTYLYDLAGGFMTFYEACPVLKADEPTRTSRMALCDLTARTIQTGLSLLGIETLEQM